MASTEDTPVIEKKKWTLGQEQELRLEISNKENLRVKLVTGTAEVFGTELGKDVWYVFSDQKLAIYTWHGCELIGEGSCTVDYVAEETPMNSYINIHTALEGLRDKSEKDNVPGPKVLIVGPKDSGKTSLAKILLSYAVRQNRAPIFIDLDPCEGSVTMPGSLTATPLKQLLDIELGLANLLSLTTEDDVSPQPLVYYFGYSSPAEKTKLYQLYVERLGDMVAKRLASVKENRVSGCIIDSCGLADEIGTEVHRHTIETLKVNVVIVVGHERLYSDLMRSCKDSDVTILRLPKSGGVVNRDPSLMRYIQMKRIREYFYGCPNFELSPSPNLVKFDELNIYKVGQGKLAPSSALPVGMDRKVSETQLSKVEIGEHLLHAILAVCNSDTPDESLVGASTHGFVYISEIDMTKQTMTLLMPCPGRIPKKFLMMGDFRWIES